MKEQNKNTLDKAIKGLKTYQAPKVVWNSLEMEMEKEIAQETLQKGIDGMPQYQAPTSIWNQIEQELDAPVQLKQAVIRSIPWRQIAAAAVLVGITLFGLQWLFNSSEDKVNYSYTQEMEDDKLLLDDWTEDEAAFEMVMAFCEDQEIVCAEPEFKNLKEELHELNQAKEDLVVAMENYGKDAELIAQLTEVEHERSDILKKMIAKI